MGSFRWQLAAFGYDVFALLLEERRVDNDNGFRGNTRWVDKWTDKKVKQWCYTKREKRIVH